MLNGMNGIEHTIGVLIVVATNRVNPIVEALLRPRRFDRVAHVPPPDLEARRPILSIYTRDIPLAEHVDLDAIAQTTELYTGADMQNVRADCVENKDLGYQREYNNEGWKS
ncbi:hypothetical protein BGX34_004954 [Mortierella sp. NVP85]|nr:hypothetical protein BGX34_004954 [Mortierella sp. NVP85]